MKLYLLIERSLFWTVESRLVSKMQITYLWITFCALSKETVLSISCRPAHASLVWCAEKIARATSVYGTYCLVHWNAENERTKISNWIVDHFSLTFVNFSWTWMLYFHAWPQNKGEILSWSGYYNQFDIY